MCSLCVTRSGLHGPLWAGTETGALQELATCHSEREKVQTHLLRTERTLHKQWVQFRGRCDVSSSTVFNSFSSFVLFMSCIVYLIPAFSSCAFILCFPSHFSFSFFVIHTMSFSYRPPTFSWCNGVCPASVGQRSSPLGTSGTRQSYCGPASVHETRPSPTHDTHSQLAHVR